MFEPFVAAVYLAILWQLVGPQLLFGFAVIILFIVIQIALGPCAQYHRHQAASKTDHRLKLVFDSVSGIRTIKAYGWELQMRVSGI